MNSKEFQRWLQIGGLLGVVVSLVFVGVPTMQTHEIALSNAYQARADTSIALKMAPLASNKLFAALTKMDSGTSENLTSAEQLAAKYYFYSQLVYLENEHYNYTKGFISREQWDTNIGDLIDLFSVDVNRAIWAQSPGRWRASFVTEVNVILDNLDHP